MTVYGPQSSSCPPTPFRCAASCHRIRQPRGHITAPSPTYGRRFGKARRASIPERKDEGEKKYTEPCIGRVWVGHNCLEEVLGRSPTDGGDSNVNEQCMHSGYADRGAAWILTTAATAQFVAT
jgi:hypothetical protein